MANLYAVSKRPLSLYKDRRFDGNSVEREQKLLETSTLYVGNLSFYTTEEQVFDLFSKVGEIKRIIMGLDRIKKTPCGFCFVEYFTREDAEKSVQFLCDTKLDERTIRVDYDIGFKEGRQYGRGRSGGQVRDEHRIDYDPGRGGFGKANSTMSMSGHEMWGNHEPDRGGVHGPPSMHPPSFHHMNQHHQPPPSFGPGGHHPSHFGPGSRNHPPYPPPPQHFHEGSHHHGPPPHYMYRRGGGRGGRGRGPRGGGGGGGPPPHGGGMPPRYFNGGGGGMPGGGNGVPPLYDPHPPSYGKRFRDDMPQFNNPSEMNMPKRHRPEVDDMQNQN